MIMIAHTWIERNNNVPNNDLDGHRTIIKMVIKKLQLIPPRAKGDQCHTSKG